jgi:hypothetical protein
MFARNWLFARFLRFEQRLLRALVGGDVVQKGDAIVKNAVLVSQRSGVHADP